MKEIRDIINAAAEAEKHGIKTALATVVHVEGSSYRQPGARMLISENGELTGAISGGCLEGDALRKALMVIRQEKNMLVTYDTLDEDDAKFGIGLGCNGIIQVLIEPVISADTNNPIQLLKELASGRQEAALLCLFSLEDKRGFQPGTCYLQKINDYQAGTIPGEFLQAHLKKDLQAALENKTSVFINYISPGLNLTAFIEFIWPSISLVVAGAGNDVIPLVKMADIMGWQTIVVDGRPAYVQPDRFVDGCVVKLMKPESVLREIPVDEQTVFLLMTHNYNYDLCLLKHLIQKEIAYIGLLGPQKKWIRMLDELAGEGILLTAAQMEIIHNPVGLDIGAETPEEIALSILAEIKAVLSKRTGMQLRRKSGSIHSHQNNSIEKIIISS